MTSKAPTPNADRAPEIHHQNQQALPDEVRGRILNETGFGGPNSGVDKNRYTEVVAGSLKRDVDDIGKDREAMKTDHTGIQDARSMVSLNNEIIQQLNTKGKLSPELIERAKKVYGKYMDSLKEDKNESADYAGTLSIDQAKSGFQQAKVESGIQRAGDISAYAKELAGNPSPERRADLLHLINRSATSLQRLGQGERAVIGKDASDAGQEATNIKADIATLATLTPGSPEYKQTLDDIQSKAGLITRELADIKDEVGYVASDDQSLTQASQMLAALGKLDGSTMAWKDAFAGLIQPLQQVNKTLASRISGFKDDLKNEPGYIKADSDDAALDQIMLRRLQHEDIYAPTR